jgi:hypothetical protein
MFRAPVFFARYPVDGELSFKGSGWVRARVITVETRASISPWKHGCLARVDRERSTKPRPHRWTITALLKEEQIT